MSTTSSPAPKQRSSCLPGYHQIPITHAVWKRHRRTRSTTVLNRHHGTYGFPPVNNVYPPYIVPSRCGCPVCPRPSMGQGVGLCRHLLRDDGAVASHAFVGDPLVEHAGALVVLSLTCASYWLRPASLRLVRPTETTTLA